MSRGWRFWPWPFRLLDLLGREGIPQSCLHFQDLAPDKLDNPGTDHLIRVNAEGLDSCTTWGKTRQNYPFPSKSSGFQQLALICALSTLLALENLDLEVWLWFPQAVTHTPSKVNAAVSENGHKRAVEAHYDAVNLHAGLRARRKCFKAEERVQIRKENKDSERVIGSKLVRFTSVFLGPRPKSSKLVRDASKTQMVLL